MKKTIVIADDFYRHPDAVVDYAKTLKYMCPYNSVADRHSGVQVPWRASRWRPARQCPFKSSKLLISRLEFLTGERIDRDHWRQSFPVDENGHPAEGFDTKPRSAWWNCTFHAKHRRRQELGEGVHSHTDRDSWNAVGEDGWAGLIYLSEVADRQSGLRTWENIDTARTFDWMTPSDNWVLRDTFANVYNRLILHRGGIPHSGSSGWGNTVDDGRLFQTFFFRTSARTLVRSLDLRL
jgi:hypothetical protein